MANGMSCPVSTCIHSRKHHRSQKQQVMSTPGSEKVTIAVSQSLTPLQRRPLCSVHTDVPPMRELGASAVHRFRLCVSPGDLCAFCGSPDCPRSRISHQTQLVVVGCCCHASHSGRHGRMAVHRKKCGARPLRGARRAFDLQHRANKRSPIELGKVIVVTLPLRSRRILGRELYVLHVV